MKKTTTILFFVGLLAGEAVFLYARSDFQSTREVPSSKVLLGVTSLKSANNSSSVTTLQTVASTTVATHTIGQLQATPDTVPVNASATVTVTIQITDPSLIPNGVNLLRLGPTGTQPIILGQLQGNASGTYAGSFTFNESATGQIQLQGSAAFRGLLKRIVSNVITINVWNGFSDNTGGFSSVYPPGWTLRSSQDTITISSTTVKPVFEGDAGNEIEINVLPTNGKSPILEWLRDYYSGEVDFTRQPVTYYTNHAGIQFAIVSSAPALSSDNKSAYTILNGSVVQISVSPASLYEPFFNVLLSKFLEK